MMTVDNDNSLFEEQDAFDGIRMSWHTLPLSAGTNPANSIMPMGVLYAPLKNAHTARIDADPDYCADPNCGAVFNIHCSIIDQTTWMCNFCSNVNRAPFRHVPLRRMHHSTVEFAHRPLSPAHSGHSFPVSN